MADGPSDRSKIYDALQQSRQRLDQSTLIGRAIAANLVTNLLVFVLGVVLAVSYMHGESVQSDVKLYESQVRVLEQQFFDLKAEVGKTCQVPVASSSIQRLGSYSRGHPN